MKTSGILRAWGKILLGQRPSLSIEITKECPLRCPGCYAYDEAHLTSGKTLRSLSDQKGQQLIDGILKVVDRVKPLHLSLIGGEPLVRHRELETLIPLLLSRGIHVQVVTSAVRELPKTWTSLVNLTVAVSIDGLRPEHDLRRYPATYETILKNISGQKVTVHCTITSQMMKRKGYLREFLDFWTPRSEVQRVWFSLFTPQVGETLPEVLTPQERNRAMSDLLELRCQYKKLDMREGLIRQFALPPHNPKECIFAQTTEVLSADLTTRVTPCQFGGNPDCASCGCMASMGLAAIGKHRIAGFIPVGKIFTASIALGRPWL